METWINEAREALTRRRNRMQTRGAQSSQQVQLQAAILAECDRQELRDIEDALERIQKGVFGRCSQCGGAIGRHRLRAVPEARYCLGCSALVRADAQGVQGEQGREQPRLLMTR
jgi:DnaK suppressor protein